MQSRLDIRKRLCNTYLGKTVSPQQEWTAIWEVLIGCLSLTTVSTDRLKEMELVNKHCKQSPNWFTQDCVAKGNSLKWSYPSDIRQKLEASVSFWSFATPIYVTLASVHYTTHHTLHSIRFLDRGDQCNAWSTAKQSMQTICRECKHESKG